MANSSEIVVFCGRRNKIGTSRMPASWMIGFREFLDKMPVPGYLFDPEGRHFVAANQSFCDLVGYGEPELIALELPLIMADEGETVRANEEISGRQEDVFRVNDFAFRRKDGARVNAHIQYRVMRVVDGESTRRQMYFAAVVSQQAERKSTGLINLLRVAILAPNLN
jgi:PAS domain S-box-containing protein